MSAVMAVGSVRYSEKACPCLRQACAAKNEAWIIFMSLDVKPKFNSWYSWGKMEFGIAWNSYARPSRPPKPSDEQQFKLSSLRERRKSNSTLASDLETSPGVLSILPEKEGNSLPWDALMFFYPSHYYVVYSNGIFYRIVKCILNSQQYNTTINNIHFCQQILDTCSHILLNQSLKAANC